MEKRLRILMLEDNPVDEELETRVLRNAGMVFDIKRVETERDFRKAIEDFDPEVILADYNVPVFDGMQALNIAKQLLPNRPFIVVTGRLNEEIAVDCIKAGAWDYVLKDRLARLPAAITGALDRKKEDDEKKKTEEALNIAYEALRKSEQKYRLLAENITDIIWTIDLNLNITYMSPSVEKILGYNAEDIKTITMSDILSERTLNDARKILEEAIEQLKEGIFKPRILEMENVCKDGSRKWMEVIATFLYGENGKAVGMIGTSRDISDRKELQEELIQAEKMAIVGTMAASVAHELRTPLVVIKTAVYNLTNSLSALDEKNRKHLVNIDRKVDEANKIISDLLDFSRVSKPEFVKVDVNNLLEEATHNILSGFTAGQMHIEKTLGEIPDIMADKVQIGQVFQNIVKNACEAMPDGGKLFLTTRVPNDEFAVEISIKDTGVGISEEDMKNIARPFFSKKAKGTGLGLALSYRIIEENHKGKISVESFPGEGTEFKIKLRMG